MQNKFWYYTLAIFITTFLLVILHRVSPGFLGVLIGLLFVSAIAGLLAIVPYVFISIIAEDVIQGFTETSSYIKSRQIPHRLTILVLSEQEEEHIVGDLHEEFIEIRSKSEFGAYMWLCKQVLKSVLPLIYKTAKSHVASYFGERAR